MSKNHNELFLKEQFKKAVPEAEKLPEILKRAVKDVDLMLQNEVDDTQVKSTVTRCYIDFMIKLLDLYKTITGIFGEVSIKENLKAVAIEKLLQQEKRVEVATMDNALLIRLPRIPVKYFRKTSLFQEEFRIALEVKRRTEGLPVIKERMIHILNVFNTEQPDKSIPDNDNYDIKRITDIIMDALGNGDGACKNSFLLETVKSDSVEAGTYICITQRHTSFDDVLAEIGNAFQSVEGGKM